jgi:hypothetical protein
MNKSIPLVLTLALALSACAARYPQKEAVAAADAEEAKEYVTGSMLPQRRSETKVAKLSKTEAEELMRKLNSDVGTLSTGK